MPTDNQTPKINEDWLAVIVAFAIILLSVIGILGKQGIMIQF